MTGLKIAVPWHSPPWLQYNGPHPLTLGMLENGDGVTYDSRVVAPSGQSMAAARDRAELFRAVLRTTLPEHQSEIDRFITTRGVDGQAQVPEDADGLFIHTAPQTLPGRKFAFHAEVLDSVYWDLNIIADREADVPNSPYTPMLRLLFEHPDCRLIFSHLRDTQQSMSRLLGSSMLDRKIKYLPLGVDYEPSMHGDIGRIKQRDERKDLTYFFTNSFNHHPTNFTGRGGIETIEAFRKVQALKPGAKLVILSSIPEGLGGYIGDARATLPNLTYVAGRVSEDELRELYLDADVFVLPSIWLHSYSLLRAMAAGVVPIVGYFSNYEEFVTHAETGIFVSRGYQALAGDPTNGLGPKAALLPRNIVEGFDATLSDQIFRAMMWLAEDRELLRKMKAQCLEAVSTRHALEPWRRGIRQALLEAF